MIYNYGSINIDYIYHVPYFVRPGETLGCDEHSVGLGGKGANQSLSIARANGMVSHWGRVSLKDTWAVEELKSAGVDVCDIELTQQPSGHAIVQIDEQGENSIILFPGVNHGAEKERLALLLSKVKSGDMLLIQNECDGLGYIIPLAASLDFS